MAKRKPRKRKMRAGAGGKKGAGFERQICKALSMWVSGGQAEDLFWRTAMSGGRSTVARKRGALVRQAGDIGAVAAEGHPFTDEWLVECKFYRDVDFSTFLIKNKGKLAKWWRTCRKEAKRLGRKPLLLAKQNGWPVLVITRPGHLERWTARQMQVDCRHVDVSLFDDMVASAY